MLSAVTLWEGNRVLATKALREELNKSTMWIIAGKPMAFRGAGVVQTPPEVLQEWKYHQFTLNEDQHIIGELADVTYDQYWHMKSVRSHITKDEAPGAGERRVIRSVSTLRTGPVALLVKAAVYDSSGGLLVYYPQLQVPLADPLLQPLKVYQ